MGKQRFTRTVALLPACSAGMQGVAAKGQTDKIFIRAVRRRTVCDKPCLRLSRWRKTCCRQRRGWQNSCRVIGFLLHSRTDIFTRNRLPVVRKCRCFGNTCRYTIGRMHTQRIDFSFANKLHYRLTDSVLSVLTVGALIGIAYMISYAVKSILPDSFADSLTAAFFCGLLEMTSGVFFVTAATTDILAQTVLCSTLLGFGGIGILLQSMSFLSRCKVRSIDYLKTKLTQSSLCAIISYLLCKLFL